MSNELHVEIQPHPARQVVLGVKVPIITDQQQVMVKDEKGQLVRVGYCGTVPGKPISFIKRFPQAFKDAVVAHVEKELAGAASKVKEPPEPSPVDDDESESDE